ncbi:Eco57I restriction-modification methylase domain-containing protein [Schleiferia thermophila]
MESYKFTVAENTPIEEEIALDPELLGKVFENLLAIYNPETQTTARKQTGSFYTPREIVNYMVDESLIEYLKSAVSIPAHENNAHEIPIDEFFNPHNEIQIHTGNLPHWQQENVWYFVTFRLADSIPAKAVENINQERELWLKKHPDLKNLSKEDKIEYYRLFSERIEKLLNAGRGSCILKNPNISKIVADALNHFNNQRYILDEWVIMPNHVHVLVKPLGDNKLPDILHSWKSFTANEINKVTGNKGQVWMHESYDHIVRNENAFQAIRNYIRLNPIKANLKKGEYLLSSESMDAFETFEDKLRRLFSYNDEGNPFNEDETKALIEAINNCKILDPACGSGAFPMGILHKMVHILQKLDPQNKYWKELQRKKAIEETEAAFKIGDKEERAKRLAEINDVFENNASDYGRKLFLIENCIYGIDIQPIAVQIAKLRFFISLVIDQKVDKKKENLGIRSLPNLETKFVAANTLIGLEIPPIDLFSENNPIKLLQDQLKASRHEYFTATTRKEKLDLQQKDKELRKKIAAQIRNTLLHKKEEDIKKLENQLAVEKNKLAEIENEPEQKETFESTNIFGESQTTVVDKKKEKIKAQKSTISSIEKQINTLKAADSLDAIQKVAQQISSFDPYDQNHFANWFDPEWMFGVKDGFDIVIGNPPYISTKGVDDKMKKELEKLYGFADDTYNHFYFKGIELLKDNGILAYISSKTFWTIQTKKNLLELLLKNKILQIFDTANPFQNAMVDTCVAIVQKTKSDDNYIITFLDGRKDLLNPDKYFIHQNVYKTCPNQVFFVPTDYNKKIYERFGKKINELLKEWWDKISTSKNIDKNKKELELYRKSLKPGDITLLGLITEGGQGLATANNGKYIGVLEGTKWADNVRKQRPEKLLLVNEFCKKQGIHTKQQAQVYLESLSENEIRQLFDELKEKNGRDIFGQGWLYRIVSPSELADVEKLTDDEKLNGIAGKITFVPYDKGDKEGNRWYAPTPYYIDWSRENVKVLQTDPKARWQGYQFYFREGFCWSDIHTVSIKCRIKSKGIHDVKSMSLFSLNVEKFPEHYFVTLLNSTFISDFVFSFIKNTQTFQINDARMLPIIIPTPEQLKQFEAIFNRAYSIQKQRFSGQLNDKEADKKLEIIQIELDKMVEEMYMG